MGRKGEEGSGCASPATVFHLPLGTFKLALLPHAFFPSALPETRELSDPALQLGQTMVHGRSLVHRVNHLGSPQLCSVPAF